MNIAYCVKCFHNKVRKIARQSNEREVILVEQARTCRINSEEVYEERMKLAMEMEMDISDLLELCKANKALRRDLERLEV